MGFGLVTPWLLTYRYQPYEWDYRQAVEKDLSNPSCQPYTEMPIDQLKEPPFTSEGGSCWHLYTHRKYADADTRPFTLETYDDDQRWYKRKNFLIGFGLLSALALIVSLLVYALGWLVNWIRRGF